ncbi:MAG: hypothetical protein KDK62_02370 [Chlamydiia bacterium]|nr:hypothetical protein [Chlamydiia bacterium]
MESGHFWASLLGLYYLILGVILLFRKEAVLASVENFYKNPGSLLLGGIFALFLGLAIVSTHLVFVMNWQGIITLIGFLAIIKGVMMIAFPKDLEVTARRFLDSKYFTAWVIAIILLGAALFYSAYL